MKHLETESGKELIQEFPMAKFKKLMKLKITIIHILVNLCVNCSEEKSLDKTNFCWTYPCAFTKMK